MATCANCGYNFAPSDLSPSGICEVCEEDLDDDPELEAYCPNPDCGWFGPLEEAIGGHCPECGTFCDEEPA